MFSRAVARQEVTFAQDQHRSIPPEFDRLEELKRLSAEKVEEYRNSAQRDEARGLTRPSPESVRLGMELHALHQQYHEELKHVQNVFGLAEEELVALERAELPFLEERWDRRLVEQVEPTAHLDDLVESALARVVDRIDRPWLEMESRKPYRLGIPEAPLHIVSGTRLAAINATPRPHRFALMLLVAQDHLLRRDDFDFFEAAMAVPELAMLGYSLDAIRELGPAAATSLASLPTVDTERVSSIIHELVVGAALVRRGRDVQMLAENRASKVPDFELLGMGVPMAIECKRRLGLTTHERAEARHVERLYTESRPLIDDRGLHAAIEVVFTARVAEVAPAEFRADIERRFQNQNWTARRCRLLGEHFTATFCHTRSIFRARGCTLRTILNECLDGRSCKLSGMACFARSTHRHVSSCMRQRIRVALNG